jgi:hypothetical protein
MPTGKFDPPFAHSATEIRVTSPTEQDNGFPCGPADIGLFNWLIYAVQAELGHLVDFAGMTDDTADLTQVRQAIEAMIASAIGAISGGDTSGFLLMSQARTRLPIFPNVLSPTDGKIVCTSPGTGQVRVPSGASIQHRGIYPFVSIQTDLATDPNKTYHLRADLTGANPVYSLKDLTDVVYNPGASLETVAGFDSRFDDMLIARVVTNSGNVPTITNLVNLDRLFSIQAFSGPSSALSGNNDSEYSATAAINWARTPKSAAVSGSVVCGGSGKFLEYANHLQDKVVTRYGVSATVHSNWQTSGTGANPTPLTGQLNFDLVG